MTLERFRKLLDAWGGALSSWPEGERLAARRLLADDPRACAALEAAQKLDGLIRRGVAAGSADDSATSEAVQRVLTRLSAAALPEQVNGAASARPAWASDMISWPRTSWPRTSWTRLAALACAAALGIAIGILAPMSPPHEPERHAASKDSDPGSFVFGGEQDVGVAL
jgi:hypothetical protein